MPGTWKTLYLPKNFPKSQALRNYVFAHNETHMGLVLDYGSILNHHDSANVQAVTTLENHTKKVDINFRVRAGFLCANSNVQKYAVCTRVCTHI